MVCDSLRGSAMLLEALNLQENAHSHSSVWQDFKA